MEVVMRLSQFHSPVLIRACLVTYLITLVPLVATSQQKQPRKLNIAILDFDSRGAMSKDEAASLSDIFQSYLVDTEEFIVVDRSRIRTLMQEVGLQQSGVCSDVECVVEAGKILKVEKMFAGTIGKVGRIYNVNIQMIDVATARIEINRSRPYDGTVEGIAETVIPEMAESIVSQILGRPAKIAKPSEGISWLWYAGGAALLGGGAAAYLFLKPSPTTTEKKTLPAPPTLPQ
jgi:TolB-like protein